MQNNIINLYANCLPVKGATRSVICDFQRGNYIFVPNALADLFLANSAFDIIEFEHCLSEEDILIFKDYIQLLDTNQMIFYCAKKEMRYFPKLSFEWDFPSQVTNIVIDLKKDSKIDFPEIILKQLDEINCRFIQLRAFDVISIELWNQIDELIKKSEIKSIDIIAKDDNNTLNRQSIKKIVYGNKKIKSVILHGSIEEQLIEISSSESGAFITIKEQINSVAHCGIIHHSYFSVNIKTYTESLVHNSCLNRKISIDMDGNIKNCPSMKESYGNIKDTTLQEAINKPDFKRYWNITKDQIGKCRDCEFRHVCTDCRAYLENPNDIFSAPLKCGYDPYNCKWEEWSMNPLKQKAIEHYAMREIII